MAQKLEIYSKAAGGFILHIVNILLVIAVTYVAVSYFPVAPKGPYYMNFDSKIHESYDAFYALKQTMRQEYDQYYATFSVNTWFY